ncbi:hypothetical protein DFJ74DRAFT_705618 [Hyaloraphidium curvatum]|nr:hypothetical protein DFJ74DRAFT_705618 [Hyaloraphidium curvatum]
MENDAQSSALGHSRRVNADLRHEDEQLRPEPARPKHDDRREPPTLASLPPELLSKIAWDLFPAFPDVAKFAGACRPARDALWDDDVLWRRMLEAWDPPDFDDFVRRHGVEADASHVRRELASFGLEYRGFLDAYRHVRPLTRRLLAHLAAHAPDIVSTLLDGNPFDVIRTSKSSLLRVLEHAGIPLGIDARALAVMYSLIGGQQGMEGAMLPLLDFGLFGSFTSGRTRSLALDRQSLLKGILFLPGFAVGMFSLCPSTGTNLGIVVGTHPGHAFLRHRVVQLEFDPRIPGLRSRRFLDRGPFLSFLSAFFAWRLRIRVLPTCPYKEVRLAARWWTFAYASSGRVEEDLGNNINGMPVLSPGEEWEAVTTGYGYRDSPLPPVRGFPDRGADPVRWMRGRLELEGGGERWKVRLGWWVEWPAYLDDGLDEGRFARYLRARDELERWEAGTGPHALVGPDAGTGDVEMESVD